MPWRLLNNLFLINKTPIATLEVDMVVGGDRKQTICLSNHIFRKYRIRDVG